MNDVVFALFDLRRQLFFFYGAGIGSLVLKSCVEIEGGMRYRTAQTYLLQ